MSLPVFAFQIRVRHIETLPPAFCRPRLILALFFQCWEKQLQRAFRRSEGDREKGPSCLLGMNWARSPVRFSKITSELHKLWCAILGLNSSNRFVWRVLAVDAAVVAAA
jgi:hypothetical protein